MDQRSPPLFAALRATRSGGYDRGDLRADILAGIVVGIVAVPLSLALAIACGVPPQHGLYTAIIAGIVIGATGGSRTQVSGPTAAFVAILAPIAAQFGVTGLMTASAMAGVMLVGMGVSGLGRFVQLVPYPVTTGFTAGIGVVIASLQLRDATGLPAHSSESFGHRMLGVAQELSATNPWEVGLTLFTLATLIVLPRVLKRVPAPLVAIPLAAVIAAALEHFVPGAAFTTIADRFSYVIDGQTFQGLPRALPSFGVPWGDGLSYETVRALLLPATAIAILGAIESLLSAVVADGMTDGRHDPDSELVAQGLGNIIGPFFGGIAATGALARTATNIRFGARSPVAAITHGIVVLLAVLLLPDALGYLPMASLAGLLLVVAWNMAEVPHFISSLQRAPHSDAFVQLVCFGLTVWFDMVVAIVTGTVLAAILFMRRMVEVSGFEVVGSSEHARDTGPRDPGLLVYAVRGPLFFGAAHKAVATLSRVSSDVHTIVLDLSAVPSLDQTALVNLESTIARLRERGVRLVLVGLGPQPLAAVTRAGWDLNEQIEHYDSLDLVNLAPKKPSASSESGIVTK